MSSCSGIGLSSTTTSIFSGGLCSGNTRRPSMFTAKYRLREERKKVLKLSLNKVRRIEDPESFLRRSVLINNTVKRLQREVREEKMVRNGGYMSKLSSMHTFRKSFASSRLQELVHSDDPIDDSSSICDSSPYAQSFANSHNSRKRALILDSDSDVEEVLSQIYIPATPCIISAIEEEDPSSSLSSLECLSSSPSPPGHIKKPRMSCDMDEIDVVTCSPLSTNQSSSASQEIQVDDFEIDVDVVGEGERDDWATDHHSTPHNLNAETVDEVMDEFRLDFHLTSPNHVTDMENEPQVLRAPDEEPSKPSEEYKENTCEPVSSPVLSACCPPGLNVVPLADLPVHQQQQHKSPNSANSNGVGSPENSNSPEKQFSSCGHSSIFGELQSVVFHSLIASLET